MKYTNEGLFIKTQREASGLRQHDIMGSLGSNNAQFASNIERGIAGVPPKHMQAIADQLDFDVQRLVDIKVNKYREFLMAHVARKKRRK